MYKLLSIKKYLPILLVLFVILMPFVSQGETLANPDTTQTDSFREASGFTSVQGEQGLADIIASGIGIMLSLLGILFIVLMVISGYRWMTAGGNEEQVTNARKNITSAVVGLFIVLAAYGVTWFVFNELPMSASGPGGGGGGGGS